jgi:hypothetical protein
VLYIFLGRPRRRWEDNIKNNLQEVGGGYGDWIELAQNRDRWRALVSVVKKFWIYNQLDALFSLFSMYLFSTSTCFKRQALIIRREQLYQYILWCNTLKIK